MLLTAYSSRRRIVEGGEAGPALLAWADFAGDSYGVGETEYTSSDIVDLTGGPSGGGATITGSGIGHPGGAGPKSFEFKALFADVVIGHEVVLVVTFAIGSGDTAEASIIGLDLSNDFKIRAFDSSGASASVFDNNGPDSIDFSGGATPATVKAAVDYTAAEYRASYNGGSIGTGVMGSPESFQSGTLAGKFNGASSPDIASVYVYAFGADLQALSA
jgi:hypothetical protein